MNGIQRRAWICWNISLSKIQGKAFFYILVNLNADTLEVPEFFILSEIEVKQHFKPTKSGRDYLDYNQAKKLGVQEKWEKL